MLCEDVLFQFRNETIFLCMIVPPLSKSRARQRMSAETSVESILVSCPVSKNLTLSAVV